MRYLALYALTGAEPTTPSFRANGPDVLLAAELRSVLRLVSGHWYDFTIEFLVFQTSDFKLSP
jgi:hypothetical protein